MFLREVEIVNWQCIKKTRVLCEKLMVLIGPANQGKSSVISAIMTFLNVRLLEENDMNDPNEQMEIMGIFEDIPDNIAQTISEYILDGTFTLKIIKNKDLPAEYKVFTKDRTWVKVTSDNYLSLISNISVLFIPSVSDVESTKKFSTTMIDILEKADYDLKDMITHIRETYDALQTKYVSKGLHRKLLFEVFKELIENSKNYGKTLLGNTILLFEEPEFYLSPQESKELYDILHKLTKLGSQFFIATHSSNFVSLKHYKSIGIVRDAGNDKGSVLFQFPGNLFSGDEVKDFNMNYWINPDRSELFFASRVILVEGQTDKIVLSSLAEKLNVFKYDHSIIECGSKSIIPQFMKLLNSFRIPYVAVYDKDQHDWRTSEEKENSEQKNRSIQRAVNTNFGLAIAMENDIEEEIYNEKRDRKNYKNKPFYALQTVMEENYAVPDRLKEKVLKIFE